MRTTITLLIFALGVPALLPLPGGRKLNLPTRQSALIDSPLDDATVAGWFDASLKQGNGQPCVVRTGNEVTELVDGPAATKAMSDAMRAARPNLTVLKTFGATPGDPLYPREFGSCVEGN